MYIDNYIYICIFRFGLKFNVKDANNLGIIAKILMDLPSITLSHRDKSALYVAELSAWAFKIYVLFCYHIV